MQFGSAGFKSGVAERALLSHCHHVLEALRDSESVSPLLYHCVSAYRSSTHTTIRMPITQVSRLYPISAPLTGRKRGYPSVRHYSLETVSD
jgi:hypothetical protein